MAVVWGRWLLAAFGLLPRRLLCTSPGALWKHYAIQHLISTLCNSQADLRQVVFFPEVAHVDVFILSDTMVYVPGDLKAADVTQELRPVLNIDGDEGEVFSGLYLQGTYGNL